MNYRAYLQKRIYAVIDPLIKGLIRCHITPNTITTLGFILNIVAGVMFFCATYMRDNISFALIGWGGAILLFAGLFDMIDGRLARLSNMSTTFGALWDSSLDRYSELLSLFGVACLFIFSLWDYSVEAFVSTFLAMVGSVMVSYVRARAEGLGLECKVGLLQRPERVVLTAIGALLSGACHTLWIIFGAMIIIAVLANVTAFWRLAYCWKKLNA